MSLLIESIGGVIIGPNKQVVIVNQNHDSWSLPKGRREPGESDEQCLRREIYEETGIKDISIIKQLGSYERSTIGLGGKGFDEKNRKRLTFYLCTTSQLELRPIDPDNPFAEWIDADEVPARLSHPEDVRFCEQQLPVIRDFLQQYA